MTQEIDPREAARGPAFYGLSQPARDAEPECEMCAMAGDYGEPAVTASDQPWHQAFGSAACRYVMLCAECAEQAAGYQEDGLYDDGIGGECIDCATRREAAAPPIAGGAPEPGEGVELVAPVGPSHAIRGWNCSDDAG